MSFIDDILSVGGKILGGIGSFVGSNSIGANVAKTALLGFAINKLTASINKDNTKPNTAVLNPTRPDPGVRLQVNPDPEAKIPVVYGRARLGGIITDAELSSDKQSMYYCITICEKTGVKYSDSLASSFTFVDIYWNDQRLVFLSDGITVDYSVDKNGSVDRSLNGLVRVYCYNGNSASPVVPENYTGTTLYDAYDIMPNWDSNKQMSDLIFAVIRIDYNKEKNLTSIGNIKFDVRNTMTQPGDCLYDYMTNTRYGAGINATEIYTA